MPELSAEVAKFVPVLRDDFARSRVGAECVVWSPDATEPSVLDALATVMLDVVDGQASVEQLAIEIHEEIGVPLEVAQRRVREIVDAYGRAQLLRSNGGGSPTDPISARELFLAPPTPCAESTSRLGATSVVLRLGQDVIRVACDARRGARALRAALADSVVEAVDDAPLAFVLTAPQGLRRSHQLTDRSGLVLSEGRGLDTGLHALASHLTAFLPPAPGTVRFRARALVAGDGMVVCLDPVLYAPPVTERDLARTGLALVDRLAIDVDVATGRIVDHAIPWPELAALPTGPGHAPARTTPNGTRAVAVVGLGADGAARVARLAANGVRGEPADLLAAATALVANAELRSAPTSPDEIVELLREFDARS